MVFREFVMFYSSTILMMRTGERLRLDLILISNGYSDYVAHVCKETGSFFFKFPTVADLNKIN